MEEKTFVGPTLGEAALKAENWLSQNNVRLVGRSDRTVGMGAPSVDVVEATVVLYYEPMAVGDQIKVRYGEYTLDVEVTQISAPGEFVARVERVFATGLGEVTGGDILAIKGREMTFKNVDFAPVT
jgi:hypothetical protein